MPEGGSEAKSGFVAVLGRPSAGKSTLVNSLCGNKVSIVSPFPQTTRNRIRGIVTRETGQLVFLDTPGYHLSERRINRRMQSVALETLEEADLVLYVVDSTRAPGEEEAAIAERIAASKIRTFVALNKRDLKPSDPSAGDVHQLILRSLEASAVYEVSALTGAGTEELLAALFAAAPTGEPFYDADYYTDQPPEFRVAEIIREKAIAATSQEIPHCLYVEIADFELRAEPWEHLWARVFLVVERESQKGILVGKGGSRIKGIRVAAEEECSRLFPYPVRLDIRVKARPKWRTDDELLGKLVT